MAIVIPSKSEKRASELRDGLRLLAWEAYKFANNLKGQDAFNGYSDFNDEWKEHDIQKLDVKGLEKLIMSLGYTSEELMQMREETYQRKAEMNKKAKDDDKKAKDDVPY
jgi:hypothetical protein